MPTRSVLLILTAAAVAGLLIAGAALGAAGLSSQASPIIQWIAGLGGAIAFGAVIDITRRLHRHFIALQNLRDGVVMLLTEGAAALPTSAATEREIGHLQDAIGTLVTRRLDRQGAPDLRLAAVLGSIAEAIVVTTTTGQVSLVNDSARALLGVERVAVGTSLYAALSRSAVEQATEAAQASGHPVEADLRTVDGETIAAKVADLGEYGGAVLTFSPMSLADHARVEHDLALHDSPPPAMPITRETPLADLPVLVFDCETTGLDVTRDAIVALGGVRMHGARIYRSETIDRLVDPGRKIPRRSTAIHGITDVMVADVGPFEHHWPILDTLMRGSVLVGHNILFDIAQLRAATQRSGIDWASPLSLDTLLLVAALEPHAPGFDLEAIAERFGVSVHGRHTALGDSLVTAEIYARLIPRLAERNVTTLGDAMEFAQRAKVFVKRQRQAGWTH
ncbi:MAG: hypothetical protein GKS00_04745 [Alphaproteobacteria bacterium]|nr:hypothetical protein [Alphaproteobacteria bacterium]